MKNTSICLKPINDLLREEFYIPAYQRGYRWGKQEVLYLLEDVMAFQASDENRSRDGFYCLQPIVVKERADLSAWEVVDGQQRLTTLLLILHYFNQRYAEEFQKQLYTIEFETRVISMTIILELDEEKAKQNVDYHFLFLAKRTIKAWFDGKGHLINDFEGALLNRVKVIWYELPKTESAVDAFTRLNVGKIPLTNAELVRALFLRSRNFPQHTADLEQLKIAHEWDVMEKALQNDDFWYFLTDDAPPPNRIELVFDLIVEAETKSNRSAQDNLSAFHHFSRLLSEATSTPDQLWGEVKTYFMTQEEWYHDRELFHIIGYLITEGDSVLSLIMLSKRHGKRSFRRALKQRIFDQLIRPLISEGINIDDLHTSLSEFLGNLEYGADSARIKSTLLLFNIASIIENAKSIVRFRFDHFKTENWDIEHIRSVESGRPSANIDKRPWLEVVCRYFDEIGEGKE